MVCIRCKMAVEAVLQNEGIPFISIELGKVYFDRVLSGSEIQGISAGLKKYELEILDNKRQILVERIKNMLTELIRVKNTSAPLKFTAYLNNALNYDYTYMSNVFSEEEGSTIERFYIVSRIEFVKELLIYEQMSLKEIAWKLNYSSISHLCLQFKKITGKTPSEYKKLWLTPEFSWKTA